MHIGIDANAWDNERGFGRFTRCLVEALARRDTGFHYTLLFGQPPERPVPDAVTVVIAGAEQSMSQAASGTGRRGGGDMLGQSRAAARLDCDVFFFPAAYSYYPIFSRVPKVICFHDTIPERFPDLVFPSKRNFRLWQAKIWLAKWQATRILTISQASAADLTRILGIPPTRIDVTTEGADPAFRPIDDPAVLAAVRARHGIAPQAKLLVYIGGFNRHKNVIRLIEAMPKILAACPDACLAIVGRTTGDRFWDNIDELKAGASRDARASDRIVFTGEIDDGEMAELLNGAEALVMPSLWEGFGLPALEAMTCGTPVLASNCGSLPEVVAGGGLYFDPLSRDDIAARAIEILSSSDLQASLAARARARAADFSWDLSAALTEESFRNAAPSGG